MCVCTERHAHTVPTIEHTYTHTRQGGNNYLDLLVVLALLMLEDGHFVSVHPYFAVSAVMLRI